MRSCKVSRVNCKLGYENVGPAKLSVCMQLVNNKYNILMLSIIFVYPKTRNGEKVFFFYVKGHRLK